MNFIDLLQLFCAALAILTIVRIAIDAVQEAHERSEDSGMNEVNGRFRATERSEE